METNQTNTPKTATQRLEDIEAALSSSLNVIDTMARDLLMTKDALKLLGNKLDAVVKAVNRGNGITDEVISQIMIENNAEDLKQKVSNLLAQNVLAASTEVSRESFVVGREIDKDGNVFNPRLQFAVAALQPEVSEKLTGSKVGDLVEFEDGKFRFEVMEVYSINTPTPQAEDQKQTMEEMPVASTEGQSLS